MYCSLSVLSDNFVSGVYRDESDNRQQSTGPESEGVQQGSYRLVGQTDGPRVTTCWPVWGTLPTYAHLKYHCTIHF